MRWLDREEEALAMEALGQCTELLEMAKEAENLVACYETVRVSANKLATVSVALAAGLAQMVQEGQVTPQEVEKESERVMAMIHQYVDMRMEFRGWPNSKDEEE